MSFHFPEKSSKLVLLISNLNLQLNLLRYFEELCKLCIRKGECEKNTQIKQFSSLYKISTAEFCLSMYPSNRSLCFFLCALIGTYLLIAFNRIYMNSSIRIYKFFQMVNSVVRIKAFKEKCLPFPTITVNCRLVIMIINLFKVKAFRFSTAYKNIILFKVHSISPKTQTYSTLCPR